MTLVIFQEKLLTFAAIIYLFTTLCYIIYLGKRNETLGKAATWSGLIGVSLHTLGLILRWVAGGWDHPPFTNMYESLVFFGWGIVLFYLYMEYRYKVKITGAFVFPVALAAMALAVFNQDKGIMPLPDALQSWWLHIHVFFASIAYAAFIVAFAFSLMFLIKDKVESATFACVASALTALTLFLVQIRAGFSHISAFFLTKAVIVNGKAFPIEIPGTETVQHEVRQLPFVGLLFLVSIVFYALSSGALGVYLSKKDETLGKLGKNLSIAGTAAFSMGMFMLIFFAITLPDVSLKLDIYLFLLLVFICLICIGAALMFFKSDALIERLPAVDNLDFLSYRSVVVAFPLMTIVIVTGAVWAQQAWGRYWGWDPKETASLITWLIYAVYLHTRIVKDWKGRPSAIISLIGFLSVVFTYLGVNIFLSGLHAYASK